MPSEWLPPIWGDGEEEADPALGSADDVQALVGLIMRHYNAIARDLQRGPGRYAPIYDVDARHDEVLWELWIAGFERAMALRPESWAAVLGGNEEDAVTAMTGLLALISIGRGGSEGIDQEPATVDGFTREAPDLIPPWIETLNAWRLKQDRSRPPIATTPHGKIGRNDPCPCGSGKKYKKCCGLN